MHDDEIGTVKISKENVLGELRLIRGLLKALFWVSSGIFFIVVASMNSQDSLARFGFSIAACLFMFWGIKEFRRVRLFRKLEN